MINPFKLISTRKVYENPWISVREDAVIRPGGKEGIFWVVDIQDGVTVLAIDTEWKVILTYEYKYAVEWYTYELVSGWVESSETPIECAKRELQEETWFTADEWTELGYIDPFTNIVNSKWYMFLARGLHQTSRNPDEWEIIKISSVRYAKVLEMVINSEITHGASIAAILKAQKYISK
jgi:8-oxo-dGTP pyrophosphatase MutT (NUDIX family)